MNQCLTHQNVASQERSRAASFEPAQLLTVHTLEAGLTAPPAWHRLGWQRQLMCGADCWSFTYCFTYCRQPKHQEAFRSAAEDHRVVTAVGLGLVQEFECGRAMRISRTD